MYLQKPSNSLLTDDFLDDFRILPTNYYDPQSPRKFQDFIDRWGTHVVKSAHFGGKLVFSRTAEDDGTVNLSEFHEETQKTFESITANNYAKNTEKTQKEELNVDVTVSAASSNGFAGSYLF